MLALAAVAITFLDVSAWKHVPVREVWIPALRATVVNASGVDWAEASLRIRSHCADGEAAYEVKIRNLLVGEQKLEAVIYDGITRQSACVGASEVEFLGGTPIPEDQRPAFVILGFRLEDAAGNVSAHLEGIIEHRRRSDTDLETERLYWEDGGQKIHLNPAPDYDLYCFRVRPGEMGIAGFLLNRDAQSEGPLTRFLRFFEIPPGKEAWLGVFEIKQGPGRLVSVTIDGKPEMVERLQALRQRAVVAAAARRPRTSSILTVAK
jgi:hypothetical protein